MNRWEELYNNHPIHATLKWLRESVETEFTDIATNDVPEKRRFLKLLTKYEDVFTKIDHELIPFNQIDSLNTGLRQQPLAAQLNNYVSTGNSAHLAAANDLFTNQLTQLSLLLPLLKSSRSSNQVKPLEELLDSSIQVLVNKKDDLILFQ